MRRSWTVLLLHFCYSGWPWTLLRIHGYQPRPSLFRPTIVRRRTTTVPHSSASPFLLPRSWPPRSQNTGFSRGEGPNYGRSLAISSSSSSSSSSTDISAHKTPRSTSVSNPSSMRWVDGLRTIVDAYDVFLLDMWGVLHDGSQPYEGVLEALQQLRQTTTSSSSNTQQQQQQKRFIILSNSSKRRDNSVRMLSQLGFDPSTFEQILTSGEVAHQLLSGAIQMPPSTTTPSMPWLEAIIHPQQQHKRVFVLGSGDDDIEYCESCGWTVSNVEDATLIVARGTFTVIDATSVIEKTTSNDDDEAAPDDTEYSYTVHRKGTANSDSSSSSSYDDILAQRLATAAARRLPMLVTNPDKIRPDADRSPMPGSIGDGYERALAAAGHADPSSLVLRIGKPFPLVYELALYNKNRADAGPAVPIDLSRVCMIGDALETDIVGGSGFNVDTVWVIEDGIHGDDMVPDLDPWTSASSILKAFNQKDSSSTYAAGRQLSPTFVMRNFRW